MFLSYIKRYIVYIFLSKVLPFFDSFRDQDDERTGRVQLQPLPLFPL